MANFPGNRLYPARSGHVTHDDGPLTKNFETDLVRGPGRRLYPARSGHAVKDDGPLTKHFATGLARGHRTADYNVKLRGLGQRIDRERP